MKHSLLVLVILFLTGCGQGFRSQSQCSNCSSQNGRQGETEKVDLNAKISGGIHDQHPALSWEPNQQFLKLSLPLISSFVSKPIEEKPVDALTGSKVSIEIKEGGKAFLNLILPISHFKNPPKDWKQITTLPNQQALPDFSGETAYYTSLDLLDSNSVVLYFKKGQFGVYWESSFDPHIAVSYPLLNSFNQEMGFFNHIPSGSEQRGGYFLSLLIPGQLLQQLNIP